MTKFLQGLFVFFLLLLSVHVPAVAQFTQARIGVNGLTCSQCSRSVEVELSKLDFVDKVNMDLEHTRGTIIFKEKSKVNIAALASAVKNAGFSVRFLEADFNRKDITTTSGNCFKYKGDAYVFLKDAGKADVLSMKFIGKEFMPGKEFKAFSLPSSIACKSNKTYFVEVQ